MLRAERQSGVKSRTVGANFRSRPGWSWMRRMHYEFRPTLVLGQDDRRESYRLFTAPINWLFESGERFEFDVAPEGERLTEPFEIADGVTIPVGEYHWSGTVSKAT